MARDLDTLDDEELMASYQEGNENAFAILYARHSRKVYGYLRNNLRDSVFADDVFQSTFLKLHNSRSHYDPAFPFLPWLFTVCKSVMIDHIRKKNRIMEDENPRALELAEAPAAAESLSLPEMTGLPLVQKQALEMRYGQDLSFEQIAHKLETSPANVRQLVSRAVRKLKGSMTKGSKNDE